MKLLSKRTLSIAVVITVLAVGGIAYAATRPTPQPKASTKSHHSETASGTVEMKPLHAYKPGTVSTQPTTPTAPDNSAKCIAVYNAAAKDLNSLNTQIQAQLEEMKEIMASEQLAESLGSLTPLEQASYTQNYNTANEKAEKLQDQYTSDKETYLNRLVGLGTPDSSGCAKAFKELSGN